MSEAQAVLGGGCFWCLEAVSQRVPGVLGVGSGYAGGQLPDPTYRQVCAGGTGHAEVVRISFDPDAVSYASLLELFWQAHDPTTPDRQGNDVGPQYRSIILHAGPEQEREARASVLQAQQGFSAPIVTEVAQLDKFWPAEPEHSDYYNSHRTAPYCMFLIAPKLKKLGL